MAASVSVKNWGSRAASSSLAACTEGWEGASSPVAFIGASKVCQSVFQKPAEEGPDGEPSGTVAAGDEVGEEGAACYGAA